MTTNKLSDLAATLPDRKQRKPQVYRITPDSFSSQVKDMDHKDLFAIQKLITAELDRRRTEADKLVEESKGGK